MVGRSAIGIILLASLVNGETGIFEDAPPTVQPGAPVFEDAAIKAIRQQAAKLRFVIGATPKMLGEKWDEAIRLLDGAIAEAAAAGDTARHDALKSRRADIAEASERAKKTPMLPSLYPLEVGKKGCLYAVRESEIVIRAGTGDSRPLTLPLQVLSWFDVKFTGNTADGALLCDIYENSGKILLYKAEISGMDNPALKPGVMAQLVNVAFECAATEQTEVGMVYHLKKVATATVGAMK